MFVVDRGILVVGFVGADTARLTAEMNKDKPVNDSIVSSYAHGSLRGPGTHEAVRISENR